MDMDDAEQLWTDVLNTLRRELPKASFETWVRDTRAVALADGVLTISTRNSYARGWLEDHVWLKARQMLGDAVTDLRFTVAEGDEGDAEDFAEPDPDPGPEPEPEEKAEDEIEVSVEEYASLYEQAVRPERAVYLPGYFRRWLALLGPDLGWFYVGFRQAAYRSSGGRKSGQHSGRVSGRQVAALCGVTERTFWNRVGREETWKRLSGLIRRDGQRYTVAMSLPLTAPDAQSLTRWLLEHLEEYGGAEGVLNAACQTPVDELLAADEPVAAAQPMTIFQLLQTMFPNLPETTRNSYAERLRLHLMPQGDQIVVSLFFLEHILPWLKAGPAWVYVLLRDQCFVDRAGSGRDTVSVQGGYEEIASWLGVKRPQTVYDWLRSPIPQIYLNIQRAGSGNGKWENPLTCRVLLNDVPAEIVQAAATQAEWQFPDGGNAIFSLGLAKVTQFSESGNAIFSGAVTQFSVFGNAIFSGAVTQFSVFGNAIFSVLKPLTLKTKPLSSGKTDQPQPQNAQTVQGAASPSVGREGEAGDLDLFLLSEESRDSQNANAAQSAPGGQSAGWDFEQILRRLNVNKTSRKRLREQGVPAVDFISWLLQARAVMRNVDPVRIAIAWSLNAYRRAGAEADFRFLAQMPDELRAAARARALGLGLTQRYSLAAEKTQSETVYQRALGNDAGIAAWILAVLFGEQVEGIERLEEKAARFAAVEEYS
ncbi:MAG: hypothetical protein HRF47_19270 [Chloroflexota bacterium]|jgi:hypothetical protein